jgi:spore coat polysaccharide biosynthesis protein SpsF
MESKIRKNTKMDNASSQKKGRKVIVSIQARMCATRLPGKVLKEALGKPMLQHMIERVKKSSLIDDIVVTTTVNPKDEQIVALCKKIGVKYFRGSEEDVLGRIYDAHKEVTTDIVVSLYGDCPLIDPEIIDTVIMAYLVNDKSDYVTNLDPKTYPGGMDLEVFPFSTLDRAQRNANSAYEREHSSWHFRSRPKEFKHVYVAAPPRLYFPHLELVLDEASDYELIKKIFEALYPTDPDFDCADIIEYVKSDSSLMDINRQVVRNKVTK